MLIIYNYDLDLKFINSFKITYNVIFELQR